VLRDGNYSKKKSFVNVEVREDITMHCSEDGHFEEIQCDKGMCWCVDPETGDSTSRVVPETVISMLPCYFDIDMDEVLGSQYLRKCEARALGIMKAKELLGAHGTDWSIAGTSFNCDGDGSFAPVQYSSARCKCVTENNGDTAYAVESSGLESCSDMSCRCARDKLTGLAGDLACQGNGDYSPLQSKAGDQWCADPEDGWRLSNKVTQPPGSECCLDYEKYKANPPTGNNLDIGKFSFWSPSTEFSYACIQSDVNIPGQQCDYKGQYCQEQVKNCD